VFQSVIAVTHPGSPPDALAALIAAPVPAGVCDGARIGVFPLSGDCASMQKAIEGDPNSPSHGKLMGMLLNSRIMADANNARIFLLPGYNNTCIAVSVDSYLQNR
jgi:hypothetical protein